MHDPHDGKVAQNELHVYASTRSPPVPMSTSLIGRCRKETVESSSSHEPSWKVGSGVFWLFRISYVVAWKVICHSTNGIGPRTIPSVQHVAHFQ